MNICYITIFLLLFSNFGNLEMIKSSLYEKVHVDDKQDSLNIEKQSFSEGGTWKDGCKCTLGIIGGGFIGAVAGLLGGTAVGTVTLPIIGTVSGAIIGAIGGGIGGALLGAVASCD